MKKFFRLFHIRELGDTDKCRFMMFFWNRSTSIRDNGCRDISVMSISSGTRYCEVGRDSCDDDLSDSLFFQIRFEIRLVPWTDSRLGDGFLIWIVSECIEECDWPGVFLQNAHCRSSLKSWRYCRAIIIILMESEMDPDYLFVIFSEKVYEFPYICYRTVFLTKSSHSLWRDLAISMEEFIDKVDQDQCSRHSCE